MKALPPDRLGGDVFDEWVGLIGPQRSNATSIRLVAPLSRSSNGSSGSFLGMASDGEEYWVKTLNNRQHQRMPATEQIVGRVGALIGAPCCEVKVVDVPSELAGWEFRPGARLEAGLAHASLAIKAAVEVYGWPAERNKDDNAVRHVGYFALYDWCWGSDPQGLLALDADRAYYSHDHGCYLPGNWNWSSKGLRESVNTPRECPADPSGLNPQEVVRIAKRLDSVTRDELAGVLAGIPTTWPVTDQELEHVGAFLELRAPMVAKRLRTRFGVMP